MDHRASASQTFLEGGARRSAAARPARSCPRCRGRLLHDGDGTYCIACGFRDAAEANRAVVAYILAGGAGTRLGLLSQQRAKPALPFGGRHRLIDFTLANCVNSGIEHVAVLGQHRWRSVHDALELGPLIEGEYARLPGDLRMAVGRADEYSGTASAVHRTFAFVAHSGAPSVLVLAADHVYAMDYRHLLERHEARRADVTVAVAAVAPHDAHRFGIAAVDSHGRVRSFVEKPLRARTGLASMGVYAFNASALRRLLEDDAANPDSSHDFGRDIIPRALRLGLNVGAYEFGGYWRDVGTVEAYWAASMEVARGDWRTERPEWPLLCRPEYRGTPRIGPTAIVENAVITGDAEVLGTVRRSIIFPGARVERGAVVLDSVVLPGATIAAEALVRRAIIDERAVVDVGVCVGGALAGIGVLAASARVPAGFLATPQRPRITTGGGMWADDGTIGPACVPDRTVEVLAHPIRRERADVTSGPGVALTPGRQRHIR